MFVYRVKSLFPTSGPTQGSDSHGNFHLSTRGLVTQKTCQLRVSAGMWAPEQTDPPTPPTSLRPIGLRVNIWYLTRSWLERNTRGREGSKKQKLPKLTRLAFLASPHCPRGKEQGGRRLSTPSREGVGMVSPAGASLFLRPWAMQRLSCGGSEFTGRGR